MVQPLSVPVERFDKDVIEDRRRCAEAFLRFVCGNAHLCNHEHFLSFLRTGWRHRIGRAKVHVAMTTIGADGDGWQLVKGAADGDGISQAIVGPEYRDMSADITNGAVSMDTLPNGSKSVDTDEHYRTASLYKGLHRPRAHSVPRLAPALSRDVPLEGRVRGYSYLFYYKVVGLCGRVMKVVDVRTQLGYVIEVCCFVGRDNAPSTFISPSITRATVPSMSSLATGSW